MNLTKIPYEISLWEDRLTLVDVDGNEYDNFVSLDIQAETQYYKEKKLCVIGADTMDSIFRVVEPKLVRKTDGTSTLTFSIYAKCYDEEINEFVENPYVKYLTNERKVKLKYYPNGELRWLDFVIKKIDESSENYKFTYTATDLFINELSKTGYKLEFDQELENNQGTIQELAGRILETTDWMVGENSELIQQLKDEPLYAIKLTDSLTAYDIFTNEEKNIPQDKTIYAFYSSIVDGDPEYFQFIYNEDGKYQVDENDIAHDAGNYYCKKEDVENKGIPTYYEKFRGEKYVRTQESEYDKVLDQYVKVYEKDGEKRCGYTKSEYVSPSLVTNYVTNGNNILSESGWQQEMDGSLNITMYPSIDTPSNLRSFGIEFIQRIADSQDGQKNTYLLNSGFRDNLENIKEISTNQAYTFQFCGNLDNKHPQIWIAKYKLSEGKGIQITETLLNPCRAGYKYEEKEKTYRFLYDLHFNRAISYKELTDTLSEEKIGIFLNFVDDENKLINGSYFIEKFEFFPQFNGKAKDDQEIIEGIILPNGRVLDVKNQKISKNIAETYVDTKYYYYVPLLDKTVKPEEIQYEYIGIENKEYVPVYKSNFEKVRSISKKETNRFDLLQTLSETFECWCKFDIWHKETGEIMLGRDLLTVVKGGGANLKELPAIWGGNAITIENKNAFIPSKFNPYQQLKFVTFHKRIGQKKSIGFKYGMNLKSLSRSLDSNDIATKLIVKSNTNEFANGGSCNIALADENPSGENFVYDFSHYVRQGLLNQDNLNNDLYYLANTEEAKKRKWIGLYTKLKPLNKKRDKLIEQQTECVGEYSKHNSTYEVAKMQYVSTEEQLDELKDDYFDYVKKPYLGKIDEKYKDSEKVTGIVVNIERLKNELNQLKEDYDHATEQMEKLNLQVEDLSNQLRDIELETSLLIQQFETKYSRFIQEASWTSEDYLDDNLYFLDAQTTLHKSAQPKVSYTINVIELSRLEEFKNYVFDLGDITYVQDTDFFGWTYKNGIKTPYKEEIVITEQSIEFDEPEKNTIKAQNYRTAFEDLFQRLTASAQQLQFHSGEYQRAADSVDTKGNILPGCLQDAFANNAYVLANAANQSVKWDDKGITTTNTAVPAEILRITSGGMFLTEDGGEHWTTGITAKGINAKVITTGTLNTGVVSIYNGAAKSFTWDSKGLNAYKEKEDGSYSLGDFVRFDQYGIYSIKNKGQDYSPSGVGDIKQEAGFYLGNDGLFLKDGLIQIEQEGNGVIINPLQKDLGEKKADGIVFSIKAAGAEVMKITNKGDATFSGVIEAAGGHIGGFYIKENYLDGVPNPNDPNTRVYIGPKNIGGKSPVLGVQAGLNSDKSQNWPFYVTGRGILNATGANISGNITALRGAIGSWTIDKVATNLDDKYVGFYQSGATTDKAGIGFIGNCSPGSPAIWVGYGGGKSTPYADSNWVSSTPFYVNRNGELHATKAFITGSITATYLDVENAEINGKLTADNIDASNLEVGKAVTVTGEINGNTIIGSHIKNGNGTFEVTSDGLLTAKNGRIGNWQILKESGNLESADKEGYGIRLDSRYLYYKDKDSTIYQSTGWSQIYNAGVNISTLIKFKNDLSSRIRVQDDRLQIRLPKTTTQGETWDWYLIGVDGSGKLTGTKV